MLQHTPATATDRLSIGDRRAWPKVLVPRFADMPADLPNGDRFVVWQYRSREGAFTKVPINPRTGGLASVANPRTWATFAEAMLAYDHSLLPDEVAPPRIASGHYDGIGVVLTGDGLVGVDLDHCASSERRCFTEHWAADIVKVLDSYTELSPSGSGVRVLVRGELTLPRQRRDRIEVYRTHRYLTLTGHRVGERTRIAVIGAPPANA